MHIKADGNVYFRGTLDVTNRAEARLAELGVNPPRNHYPQGGEYDSFVLSAHQAVGFEWVHRGNPSVAGLLDYK
jgi:hypothetical protein